MSSKTMKAWGVKEFGDENKLQLLEVPIPTPQPRDLLVKVCAVSVNPVDTKIRSGFIWSSKVGVMHKLPSIQGYDGSGVVEQVGDAVKRFKVGDEVYFSGDFQRPGCNAEYVVVDERIVGRKPKNLTYEEAAAIPLTFLTAWEGLADGMNLTPTKDSTGKRILIIAGAGGVGSATTQLAKKVFGLTVIATSSRPISAEYCKQMGADFIISHQRNLKEELIATGQADVPYLFNTIDANKYWEDSIDCLHPLGKMVVIMNFHGVDLTDLWYKRITLFPEMQFSRPMFLDNKDDYTQHEILNTITDLIEKKILVTTKNRSFPWSQLPEAHKLQDSGKSIGKQTSTVNFLHGVE